MKLKKLVKIADSSQDAYLISGYHFTPVYVAFSRITCFRHLETSFFSILRTTSETKFSSLIPKWTLCASVETSLNPRNFSVIIPRSLRDNYRQKLGTCTPFALKYPMRKFYIPNVVVSEGRYQLALVNISSYISSLGINF